MNPFPYVFILFVIPLGFLMMSIVGNFAIFLIERKWKPGIIVKVREENFPGVNRDSDTYLKSLWLYLGEVTEDEFYEAHRKEPHRRIWHPTFQNIFVETFLGKLAMFGSVGNLGERYHVRKSYHHFMCGEKVFFAIIDKQYHLESLFEILT